MGIYESPLFKTIRDRVYSISSRHVAEGYLKKLDWQVYQDANVSYSYMGFSNYITEEIIKDYALNCLIPEKCAIAHREGDIYIHDLGKHIIAYCAGWDIQQILLKGISGVPGKISTRPASHFTTALDHVSRYILTLCNEWSGAQAVNSLDTYMAPFIRYDKLEYSKVKNYIQGFMFNLNLSARYGGQVPFSNITLDWSVPEDLKNTPVIIGGKTQNETYGEFQEEMDMFNKGLLEVLRDGDAFGHPFAFPIPTYNLTKDFNWEGENAQLLFEMTAKYGTPYFQNFINSDLNPGDVRAMCCRLQMDMKELKRKTGGLWGNGASTGSIGVVDVNLPAIGYQAKGSRKKFLEILGERMDLCRDVLESKRVIVNQFLEKGLIPYTKEYLGNFNKHFSTIGLIGMNEAILNLEGETIASPKGIEFGVEVLEFMKKGLIKYQETTGHLYNLEATPAESASYYLALKDKKRFPGIKTSGNKDCYYTNSTQLPVGVTDDIFEALNLQEKLQSTYTGGTVFHVFLGERLHSWVECKELVKKIASNYRIPYFSITPTFSICPEHGYLSGKVPKCNIINDNGEKCDKPTLTYSRVVGYYSAVQGWHNGKKEEFRERPDYKRTSEQVKE
ncbi:MAG TPA: ribonucleoside triphosphate reductase [Candidatus Dojkabacteria bacterium]|nr:ribonucleoside triphosphate reductase [Candidatus Dojkabacteria bacterium]HQF36403.1 ribonucleoside triphosphate reductase [Candidatus Dojkabacteria bacterium]